MGQVDFYTSYAIIAVLIMREKKYEENDCDVLDSDLFSCKLLLFSH